MSSLYIIPWVMLGYIYFKARKRLQFELHKLDGQHYISTILYFGTLSLVFSSLIVMAYYIIFKISSSPLDFYGDFFSAEPNKFFYKLSSVFIVGIIVSFFGGVFGNRVDYKDTEQTIINIKNSKDYIPPKNKDEEEKEEKRFDKIREAYLLFKINSNNPTSVKILSNFLFNAQNPKIPQSRKRYLQFDLTNGKVYIGIVSRIGTPDDYTKPDSIAVVTRWSGYRNSKKGLLLTTDYKDNPEHEVFFKESDIFSVKEFYEMSFFNLDKKYGHNSQEK